MNRRDRRRVIIAAAVAVAVVAAVLVVALTRHQTTPQLPGNPIASDVGREIPSRGATLSAEVITPKGRGPFPLIVMPAAWGAAATVYRAIGLQFARSGYEIVAYSQRGFGGSAGKVDFAGQGSQHDASEVISWALKHTHADAHKIAMFGMSYGAGIGLLAAAHDPRIKAVAALSTWTNVADTFDVDGTPASAALSALIGSSTRRSTFDDTVKHLQTTLAEKPKTIDDVIRPLSASRSPTNYVDQLNKNRPAIFMANAFEDSIFNPAQLIPFFSALKTPKRLELAGGDHGAPERSALEGAPNATVDDVRLWFDHFLRGVENGVEQQNPITLKDVRTGELHAYATWPAATTHDRAPLGPPGATPQATNDPPTTWSATVKAGTDTTATSGPMQFVPTDAYRPPTVTMKTISTTNAFVWSGPTLPSGLGLRGSPTVHLQLAASAPTATVFLYLYDVTAAGVGTLIDMQPYTATGLQAGKPRYLRIDMQPMCWSLPTADHLTLVVDTVDPRYQSLTPPGATITVSSTQKEPASFVGPSRA
jgi:putative CocE/NonD family hydrolase